MRWIPVSKKRLATTVKRARCLRREMTPAEERLWQQLRGNRFGHLRFRRQQPLGHYIADFYCHEFKLVIEVDGEVHQSQLEYDSQREAWLESQGYQVVRFTNEQVFNDIRKVLQIVAVLAQEDIADRPGD